MGDLNVGRRKDAERDLDRHADCEQSLITADWTVEFEADRKARLGQPCWQA